MPSQIRCLPSIQRSGRFGIFAAGAILAAGCGAPAKVGPPPAAASRGDDHDHDHDHDHEHPATLAEGVAQLEKVLATVSEKLGAGAAEAADEAVHAAGHLLEHLEGLLQKEDLAADVKEAATKAVGELNECFGKLDEALHAGADAKDEKAPAAVHASLQERVMSAVAVLKERFGGGAAAKAEEKPEAKTDDKPADEAKTDDKPADEAKKDEKPADEPAAEAKAEEKPQEKE